MNKPEYSLIEPVKSDSVPEPKPEKSQTSVVNPEKSTESFEGSPIAVEYFSVKGWPEILLNPKLDHHDIVKKISFIENAVKSRIMNQGYQDTKESYLSIIKDMEGELNLNSNHDSHIRIDKIYSLLKMIKRTSDEKERKKAIFYLINRNK